MKDFSEQIFSADSHSLMRASGAGSNVAETARRKPRRGVMNISVYRRDGEPGLCCAVPAGEPIPPFVDSGHWRLDATPLDPRSPPQGFDQRAAAEALRSMGFYMFHGVIEPEAAPTAFGPGDGAARTAGEP